MAPGKSRSLLFFGQQETRDDPVERHCFSPGFGGFGTGHATRSHTAAERYRHSRPRSMRGGDAPSEGRPRVQCRQSPAPPRRPQVRRRSHLLGPKPSGRGLANKSKVGGVYDQPVGPALGAGPTVAILFGDGARSHCCGGSSAIRAMLRLAGYAPRDHCRTICGVCSIGMVRRGFGWVMSGSWMERGHRFYSLQGAE